MAAATRSAGDGRADAGRAEAGGRIQTGKGARRVMDAIRIVEAGQLRKDRDGFGPGDTVRVQVKVIEGEKERTQAFEGVVIRKRGEGVRASFTVRRISYGVGAERTFPLHSPRIDAVQGVRGGQGRRSKVY